MNKANVATGKTTKCPACYHSFQVPEKVKMADVAQCSKCKKLLEVVNLIPLTLSRVKQQILQNDQMIVELAGAGGNDFSNDVFSQVR